MTKGYRGGGGVRVGCVGGPSSSLLASRPLPQFSAAACKAAFEALHGIKLARCSQAGVSTYGTTTYTVELVEFPDYPWMNNVWYHDGSPPLSYFSCDVSGVTGDNVTCTISDVQINSIRGEAPLDLANP
jgi:hypothetical protein